MRNVAASAVSIAASRSPLPHEHPMLAQEHKFADAFTALAVTAREMRDAVYERTFSWIYDNTIWEMLLNNCCRVGEDPAAAETECKTQAHDIAQPAIMPGSSEASREGEEWVSTCRN